jgi:hypothetical protein
MENAKKSNPAPEPRGDVVVWRKLSVDLEQCENSP